MILTQPSRAISSLSTEFHKSVILQAIYGFERYSDMSNCLSNILLPICPVNRSQFKFTQFIGKWKVRNFEARIQMQFDYSLGTWNCSLKSFFPSMWGPFLWKGFNKLSLIANVSSVTYKIQTLSYWIIVKQIHIFPCSLW